MDGNVINNISEAELRLERELFSRHPAASIGPLERMETPARAAVVERQPVPVMLPVWERLSPDIAKELLAALPASIVGETMRGLDPVRLARLPAGFDDDERERLLGLVGERAAKEVRAAALYPSDRAGALMDPRARLFRRDSTVAEVLARLRKDRRPGRAGFFVVDADGRLVGWVDMQELALAEPGERVDDLARTTVLFDRSHHRHRRQRILQLPRHRDSARRPDLAAGRLSCEAQRTRMNATAVEIDDRFRGRNRLAADGAQSTLRWRKRNPRCGSD